MSTVIRTRDLSRRFGSVRAVDRISLDIEENRIYGLLGRNGAGKTTLMQLLTGHSFPSSGDVEVYGERPAENSAILQQLSFVKESQKYPDNFKARHMIEASSHFFANWDRAFADRLVADFRLPLNRPIKKLSRGQLSSVGVIVGLASRAPITFFDEPYLGLDAVARSIFYDRLLEDYSEHPRTVILSTHLIDEVSNLLEHVILIDNGRVLIDQSAEALRGSAVTLAGRRTTVDEFTVGRTILGHESIGALASVTVAGSLSDAERAAASAAGLELAPVSLQQLIIRLTEQAQASGTEEVSL
jgi:ABC-2 type transport system ATP-binding protein